MRQMAWHSQAHFGMACARIFGMVAFVSSSRANRTDHPPIEFPRLMRAFVQPESHGWPIAPKCFAKAEDSSVVAPVSRASDFSLNRRVCNEKSNCFRRVVVENEGEAVSWRNVRHLHILSPYNLL